MVNADLHELLRRRDTRIEEQAGEVKEFKSQAKELKKQIRELKKLLVEKAKAKSKDAKPPPEASNYSVSRHEQKQKKREHKNSTGRKPKVGKQKRAAETVDLYWLLVRISQNPRCFFATVHGVKTAAALF